MLSRTSYRWSQQKSLLGGISRSFMQSGPSGKLEVVRVAQLPTRSPSLLGPPETPVPKNHTEKPPCGSGAISSSYKQEPGGWPSLGASAQGVHGYAPVPATPLHSSLWLWVSHHESLGCPDQVFFPQAWHRHRGDAGDHHGQGEDTDVRLGVSLLTPGLRGHGQSPWRQPTQQQGPRPVGAVELGSSASGATILPAQALGLPQVRGCVAVSAGLLPPRQHLPASSPREAPGFRCCQGRAPGLGSRCHLLSLLA